MINSTPTPSANSPQAQAEAMAVEVIKEWRLTGNALVSCISTALSKLIAENERLKKEAHSNDCPAVGDEMSNYKEIEILPGGKPLFTPEEYEKFRAEFIEEMERFYQKRYGPILKTVAPKL